MYEKIAKLGQPWSDLTNDFNKNLIITLEELLFDSQSANFFIQKKKSTWPDHESNKI